MQSPDETAVELYRFETAAVPFAWAGPDAPIPLAGTLTFSVRDLAGTPVGSAAAAGGVWAIPGVPGGFAVPVPAAVTGARPGEYRYDVYLDTPDGRRLRLAGGPLFVRRAEYRPAGVA